MKELFKTKTFWGSIGGIVAALAAYSTGEMTVGAAIQTTIGCVLAIFIRDGILK